jgi:hypothetical protein
MGNQCKRKVRASEYSSNSRLVVKCRTWEKVSHNLHNYDESSITTQRLDVEAPIVLVRRQNSIYCRMLASIILLQ